MAGHYFYDPRPYYGVNMSTNLMPLDELFYKYEPVPYWMDQRMAPMSYPDYHAGHMKQVMTRGPEMQQFLPYTRPELAVRDDIYTDAYRRSPHFSGFGSVPYPETRGHSQDDTYLHTMTQFPQRGYGAMAEMPMSMGYMGAQPVYVHGHTNNQNPPNQRSYHGGDHMDVTSKGNKSHTTTINNNNDNYGAKSNKKAPYNNDDDGYSNKTSSKSKQEMYNDNYGYGNKASGKSKQEMYNDDYGYGNKASGKSKQEMYNDDYGYGNKASSKKGYSNVDSYSNKSNGSWNYGSGTKQKQQQQQRRYTNDESSSDDDDDEYGSGKGGGKPLLKHGKKKAGKGSEYQSYGGNNTGAFGSGKKQSGQKQSRSSTHMSYMDSSSDEDESYAYTKKASKVGLHNQGVTKVQHGGKQHSHSHVQSFGQQPKHTQFQSQTKSVELKVPICCDNCERKVTACLEYIDGVESVLCDQWQKKVIVYGNVKPEVLLKRVRRVKKSSEFWQQQAPKRVPVY